MYSYGLCVYIAMYFHISIYRLPFICTIILVIAVAEGHKGHSTLDKAFYLGDTQVNSLCYLLFLLILVLCMQDINIPFPFNS